MIMLTDVGIDTDSVGWLLTQELIKSVLLGRFIDVGPALWVFIGVLGAFAVTRGITRFIRHRSASGVEASGPIKDITIGGVHIHHQVFGISLMFVSGLLLVTTTPQDVLLDVLALLFGIGTGLAFDEFALWLHLTTSIGDGRAASRSMPSPGCWSSRHRPGPSSICCRCSRPVTTWGSSPGCSGCWWRSR